MDRERITKLLGMMAEHFPSYQFSEDTVSAWLMVLAAYDSAEVLQAYQAFLPQGSAFAPSVSQLIKLIEDKRMAESMSELFLELEESRRQRNAI